MVDFNNIESLKNKDVFCVPDNYFDTLTERVMANIPAETQVVDINRKKSYKSWFAFGGVAAAACVGIIFAFNAGLFSGSTQDNNTSTLAKTSVDNHTTEIAEEDINEEAMNYSMIDDQDVYDYLSGTTY